MPQLPTVSASQAVCQSLFHCYIKGFPPSFMRLDRLIAVVLKFCIKEKNIFEKISMTYNKDVCQKIRWFCVVFLSCRKKEYRLLRLNSKIKRFNGLLKKDTL
jgi:plasmid replication initiation protein